MNALHNVVLEASIERLGWTLLHSVWQLAAAGLLFALFLSAARRCSPQLRYLAAAGTLAVMALLPVVTWTLLPAWQATAPAEATVTAPAAARPAADAFSEAPLQAEPLPPIVFLDAELPPLNGDRMPTFEPASPADRAEHAPAAVAAPADDRWTASTVKAVEPWLPWTVGLWGAGVLALSLWHLGGWLLIGRMKRQGIALTARPVLRLVCELQQRLRLSRPVLLLESAAVRVPTTFGWLRPAVLLPVGLATGLPLDQLQAILAHELAHIRRRDYLVNLLQVTAETLLFYHPAVWWVSHCVRVEREYCADEAAAAACGSRLVYAKALTAVEEQRSRLPGLALAASDGNLKRRIESVLGLTNSAASARAIVPAGLLAVLFAATLGLALTMRPAEATGDGEVPVAQAAVDEADDRAAVKEGSPFDLLDRSALDAEGVRALSIDHAPPELVALIGSNPVAHWNIMDCFAISPDGKSLATGGRDRVVNLWNIEAGRLQSRIDLGGSVTGVTFSPDSRYLAVAFSEFAPDIGGIDRLVLWDTFTGRQVRSFGGGGYSVAFSHDGQRIAARSTFIALGGKKDVKVWEVATGRELLSIDPRPHQFGRNSHYSIWHIAFSPDDRRLVTVGGTPGENQDEGQPLDGRHAAVAVWDAQTGEELRVIKGGDSYAASSAPFSPDGTLLATANKDGTISIWNAGSFELVHTLVGHQKPVDDMAFSPDGETLVSFVRLGSIRQWDVSTGKERRMVRPADNWNMRMAFMPDGGMFVTQGMHDLTFWNLETMKEVSVFDNGDDQIWSAAIASTAKTIALGDGHGRVTLWDVAQQNRAARLETGFANVNVVDFSPDGELLLAARYGESAQVWDVRSGKQLRAFRTTEDDYENWIQFTPDGRSVVSSNSDGLLRFWEVGTGALNKEWAAHDRTARNVSFSPDGTKLATSTYRSSKVWDLTGEEPRSVEWQSESRPWHGGNCVALSRDGRTIATDGGQLFNEEGRTVNRLGVVVLWDTATGKQRRVLEGHAAQEVLSVAFSPLDGTLASCGDDGTVRLWHPDTGELLRTIRVGPAGGQVRKLTFTRDGRHLVTLNGNGTVAVLRLAEAT